MVIKTIAEYKNIEEYRKHINSLYKENSYLLFNKEINYEEAVIWYRKKSELEIRGRLVSSVYVEKELIGICFAIIRDSYMSHTAKIYISVKKEHRRKGIASLLIKEVIEKLKQKGIKIVELDVVEDNIAAIKFYEKIGFKKICTLKKRYLKKNVYHNIIRMELFIAGVAERSNAPDSRN